MGISIVTRTGLGRRRRHADTLAALRDEHARDIAEMRARLRTVQQEAGEKLAAAYADRDRLQRRVLVLERETARQHRLIDRLQRELVIDRGLPPVVDETGGAA